jgi:hypothetical protein
MIRLQFVNDNSLASWAIQAYGHGWPSHVDVVLHDGTLLGAREDGGVQIRPAGYGDFAQKQIIMLDAANPIDVDFHTFVRQQIGKPYDHLAIAGFVANQDWRTQGAWFCSELVAAALEVSGWFPKKLARGTNKISPPELLLTLSPWDASLQKIKGAVDALSGPHILSGPSGSFAIGG